MAQQTGTQTMAFTPTKSDDELVRAIMVYNDCDDWLEIGAAGLDGAGMWDACKAEAEQYVAARVAAHPLRIGCKPTMVALVAAYMWQQCFAYAYALNMSAA